MEFFKNCYNCRRWQLRASNRLKTRCNNIMQSCSSQSWVPLFYLLCHLLAISTFEIEEFCNPNSWRTNWFWREINIGKKYKKICFRSSPQIFVFYTLCIVWKWIVIIQKKYFFLRKCKLFYHIYVFFTSKFLIRF